MIRPAALAAVLCAPAAATAGPGVPGADYFRGLYERVGRGGGADPQMLNDRVRIVPSGTNLSLTSCDAEPVLLAFYPWAEIENLLIGRAAGTDIWCLFHNNGDNFPILTCRTAAGGAFTLWPMTEGFADGQLACGG